MCAVGWVQNMPQVVSDIAEWANIAFTLIFVVEAAFKIAGLGWPQYWADSYVWQ